MKQFIILCLILISCIATGQAFEWDYKPVDFSGTPPGVDADSSHSWDAIHYEMQLQVTPVFVPNNLTLDGEVMITLEPEIAGLDTVDLHFHGLTLDAIDLEGTPCNYTRDGDMLYVALPSAYNPGDTLDLHIVYSGTPEITTNLTSLGIFYPNSNLIYTQADPFGARNWLPCWDEPWDKATFSQKLWLPEEFVVASNGNLILTVPAPPYRMWWYSMDYPMVTYLLTFSASNYETIEQTAGDVQIRHFVYPSHLAAAEYDFGRVPEMIQLYEDKFGSYPFDTYGCAENTIFSGFGAMENQTMVSFGSNLITGNRTYEDIVAHELAHMWFGDAVSYIDWPEMWLSEGFAEYSEALWSEHIGGLSAYFANMLQKHSTYYGWENPANPIPMYDPPWNQIWSAVTYQKGASVLHMLRYHLGDDDFFNVMQTYVATYLYGNASTQDYNAVVNQVTGDDYDWYFNQWVYAGGYPIFEYFGTTQTVGDDVTLLLSVAQTQHEATQRFQTDADLYIFTAGDTTIERISIDALDAQQIELVLAEEPDSVQLDPLPWILGMKNRRDDITVPDLAVSSPLIDDEGGDGFLDPGESGDFSFIVTNSGAPTSDLTVDIATDDADLTIIDGSSAVPGVAFNGQYDLCADPFEIENALGTGSRWVDFTVEITETSSGTTLAALDLSVPIGTPEILLVDDDEGGIAEINHQTALNAIRYVYRTVEYTSAGELPDLADYAAVIWACGA
ncbi:MAG: M1 family aminopeptidase, partial [bacterium]